MCSPTQKAVRSFISTLLIKEGTKALAWTHISYLFGDEKLLRLWFVVKVNCKALEPWQGSHTKTHHARAEPADRYGSCPGWLLGLLCSHREGWYLQRTFPLIF